MSQWIWRFGEFETYHNMILHTRRQQYGYPEPVVWKLYAPEPVVCFRKEVTTQGGTFRIHALGDISTTVGREPWNQKKYGGQTEITLESGTTVVRIRVSNIQTFPAIYVEGVIESDETWLCDDMSNDFRPVGTSAMFDAPDKTPEKFPFSYTPIHWVTREKTCGGVLFDFGKETFARTRVTNLTAETVRVQFGESREEALDAKWGVIRFSEKPENKALEYEPYAFRYLFVTDENAEVQAEYEYLPLTYRGAFYCNEEIINRVWDVAAYTFHLNCREFFLDGIKRDRWVWSADAYQSLFVNRYLFFDREIERRTLIALGGKQPFKAHINTIMDYSFFWIISLYEYYVTYGDREFLCQIAPQMDAVMDFCLGRTDEDGFMRGKEGDWVFIDWAPMDKTGALAGEQILYARAMECYARICRIIGRSDQNLMERSESLRARIFEKFYDEEKRVFIDSYESGKRNVTRHSNILAYLFLPCDEEVKRDIYEKVILNDEVPQITTPYFKFYENQVHMKAGNPNLLEKSIREYYGSMLETGATTLYEEYDPAMTGTEHYAMYGNPYEKSLCHAWSASPIYLLGKFRLGVENTGIAYDTFEVRPALGDMEEFSGRVPVPGGEVRVQMNKREVRVTSDIPGGTLHVGEKRFLLTPGVETVVPVESGNPQSRCLAGSEKRRSAPR